MELVNGVYQCKSGYVPSSSSSACVTCATLNGYTLQDGTCELTCDDTKAAKHTNTMKCTYCYKKTTPEFLYNNNCETSIPVGAYESDTIYKIISACNSTCRTCEEEATKCTSCTDIYYLTPTGNECTATLDGFYGQDKTNTSAQQWVNCKTIDKVRYLDTSDGVECIDKPETGVYSVPITLTEDTDYGIIDKCHLNCETCNTKGDDTD